MILDLSSLVSVENKLKDWHHSMILDLRWLPGYENGSSALISVQPVNGLWQNLIT